MRDAAGRPAAFSPGVLLIVCAVALVLRLIGLRYGLPALYNPDEVAIMSRALAFAKRALNPQNFLYPSFYFYALFGWEALTAVWSIATGAAASFADFQRQFFLDPSRVYVSGRLLTALSGTATVVAVFALARRVAGNVAATSAALFMAVSPLAVRDAHYVKHDVPVTLLIVLSYLTYERLWRQPAGLAGRRGSDLRRLMCAAAMTGVAFSTHYYTIFLAVPLAWSALRGASDMAQAARRIALAALVSGAIFFVLSPFVLAEPAVALRDIRANQQIVVDRAVGTLGYAQTAARYAMLLWHDSMGWPVIVLSLAGGVIFARTQRQTAAWLLAFTVPFLFFIAGTYPASRYLIPVLPFVAVFAGIAVEAVAVRSRTLATVLVATACVLPIRDSIRTDLFIRQTDTRTLAQRFIESQVPSGTTVLTQPYSVPLEATADVLREAVARAGREMPTRTRLELARTPYPSPSYRLIYLGQGLDADKLYLPYNQLDGPEPLRPLRDDHVAIIVLKRYNTADPNTLPLLTALAREGRRIAVFTPYRDAPGTARPEPFLHNTDARIDPLLERPGPVVEIWHLNGPRS